MAVALRRSLAAKVYGVTVLVLLVSIGAFGFLQGRIEAREHQATTIAATRSGLAIASEALADELLVADFAAMDQSLLQIAQLPGLLRLQIVEPDGTVLSDVHSEGGRTRIAVVPIPSTIAAPSAQEHERTETEAGGDRMIAWHAIRVGGRPLGWVRATIDLTPLRAALRELALRTLLLGACSLLASLALLLWILHGPLGAIRQLARFARQLAGRKGDQVSVPSGTEEVDQLRDSLNLASLELARGDQRLLEEEAAKRSLEAQLLQAQKMEALGVLAGGIAHDFNNLLTAISGYANLAAEDAQSKPLQEDLEQILVAAERAATLTGSLLTFSRKQKPQTAPVDLNAVVAGVARMLERVVGEDIAVRVETAAAPVVVMADRGQLDQILVNLAANARDAMPGGGILSLSARRADVVPEAGWPGGAVPAAAGCLTVSDTGTGMEEGVRLRIFEPFFTTKGKGRGTGLGLAIVHGIVTQHRGVIEVQSAVGAGTTFRIFFPLAEPEIAEAVARTQEAAEPRDHGTVLVVEDDPLVNRVLTLALERGGYTVLSAETGQQGLQALRETTPPIDVLLSDVIMPEMNGVELVAEARRSRPDLPAILMSGYTADVLERRGALPRDVEVLPKPVSPQRVRAKVREVLAARR